MWVISKTRSLVSHTFSLSKARSGEPSKRPLLTRPSHQEPQTRKAPGCNFSLPQRKIQAQCCSDTLPGFNRFRDRHRSWSGRDRDRSSSRTSTSSSPGIRDTSCDPNSHLRQKGNEDRCSLSRCNGRKHITLGVIMLKTPVSGQMFPLVAWPSIGPTIGESAGYLTASSVGTTLTASASANVKGAYAELIASTAKRSVCMIVFTRQHSHRRHILLGRHRYWGSG